MNKKIKITIEVIDAQTNKSDLVSVTESDILSTVDLESIDGAEEAFIHSGYRAVREVINTHLSDVSKKK